jgi:hypothetical protein
MLERGRDRGDSGERFQVSATGRQDGGQSRAEV